MLMCRSDNDDATYHQVKDSLKTTMPSGAESAEGQ